MALSEKQLKFAEEYLIDLNATAAAKRAGYSEKTAYSQGQRLLKHVEVQAAIQAARDRQQKRVEITADMVLKEYARVAFFDPRKLFEDNGIPKDISMLDDDTAAAVVGLDVYTEHDGTGEDREVTGYTKKYKVADKLRALDALAKHLGLFDGKGAEPEKDSNNLLDAIKNYEELNTDDLPEVE